MGPHERSAVSGGPCFNRNSSVLSTKRSSVAAKLVRLPKCCLREPVGHRFADKFKFCASVVWSEASRQEAPRHLIPGPVTGPPTPFLQPESQTNVPCSFPKTVKRDGGRRVYHFRYKLAIGGFVLWIVWNWGRWMPANPGARIPTFETDDGT